MDRVNAVHIVEDLKTGGLEKIIALIVTHLDKNKFDVKVWCLAKGGAVFDDLQNKDIDIEILGMKSHRNPLFYIKLIRKLKKNNIHIVHAHGFTATTVGRVAAILARTPAIICHMHSNYWWYSKKKRIIDRLLGYFTDKIVCCSRAVAKFVVNAEKINSNKVKVIYNGVDVDKFNSIKPETEKNTFIIGCIGSFFPHKGHCYLIEAARKIIDDYGSRVKFVLAGDGPLRESLEDYVKKLGVKQFFDFKGLVVNIEDLISSFDLVVLPSILYEGLGISLIEAMAAAKPVIGTNVGGIPEVIQGGENGLLVEPKDSNGLAKAILSIMNDKDKAITMGRRGKDIVQRKFSSQTMVRSIEELYSNLAKEK